MNWLFLFFYACGFALDGEFDAVRPDLDEFAFEEVAHSLFEDFLADAKGGINVFGWRLVVVGGKPFVG